MPQLQLSMFGTFQVLEDHQPVKGLYEHTKGLLAYVAADPSRAHSREMLAELLWPNDEEEVARRNLRQAISRLRGAIGDRDADIPYLIVDRNTIQFNQGSDHVSDLSQFGSYQPDEKKARQLEFSPEDLDWLKHAVAAYKGHFLENFYMSDNPSFDDWLYAKREAYKHLVLRYLEYLSAYFEQQGDLETAIDYSRRQVEIEPWQEPAHRQLMRLLAKSGQRSAALTQFIVCRDILANELGVEPESETIELNDQIRRGTFTEQQAPKPVVEKAAPAIFAGRKQVTVLACGLSSEADTDPEDLLSSYRHFAKKCEDIAERYHATLQQAPGGGLVMYFGYPRVREDDVSRSIQAGLSIVAEFEKIDTSSSLRPIVRVGIHTGVVIILQNPDSNSGQPVIMGSPINIAEQLRYLADPNSVMVSNMTHRLIHEEYLCRSHHFVSHPEIASALPAHHVIRSNKEAVDQDWSKANRLLPLIGRETELAALLKCWRQSKDGDGQLAAVRGYPGIGKSRLVQALKSRLAHDSHLICQARCLADFESSAFHPIIELIKKVCKFKKQDSAAVKLKKMESVLSLYPEEYEERVQLYAQLLGIDTGNRYKKLNLSPQASRLKIIEAIVQFQRQYAEIQPVLWVLEDVHWADPSTIDLVNAMAKALAGSKIFMVLTVRPVHAPNITLPSNYSDIQLEPITEAETRRLISNIAHNKRLPDEVMAQIIQRSDGVPLYVEEFTKTFLESGILQEKRHHYELVDDLSHVQVPSSLQDILMARLDRMGTAKMVAQQASIIGREFSLDVLKSISPLKDETLSAELKRLLEVDILYRRKVNEEEIYCFRHALIHEAAYGSQLKSLRQDLHLQVAQKLLKKKQSGEESASLSPLVLAQHFALANDPVNAVKYWKKSGYQAIDRSANVEALSHFRSALEHLKQIPESLERDRQELSIRIGIGIPLIVSGAASHEVIENYQRASELIEKLPESDELFSAYRSLCSYYSSRGEYEAALNIAEKMRRLGEQLQNDDLLLEAYRSLGTNYLLTGDFPEAKQAFISTQEIYDPHAHGDHAVKYGMDPGLASEASLGVIDWCLGAPDQGSERVEATLALARKQNHAVTLGWVLNMGLTVAELRGEYAHVIDLGEELNALCIEQELGIWSSWSNIIRLRGKCALEPDETIIDQMLASLEKFDASGAIMGRPYAAALVAEACLEIGKRYQTGLDVIGKGLMIADKYRMKSHVSELYRLQGDLLIRKSAKNHEKAFDLYKQSMELAQSISCVSFELRSAISWADALMGMGKTSEAKQMLQPLIARFNEGFNTEDIRTARELLGGKRLRAH